MATQTEAATGSRRPDQPETERAARFLPGLAMLALGLVGVVAGVILAIYAHGQHGAAAVALGLITALVLLASALGLAGVVQLFGRYRGSIREPGLQWVNPFTRRIVVSTRIRNQESGQAKVNDADGNPIEIAAVD